MGHVPGFHLEVGCLPVDSGRLQVESCSKQNFGVVVFVEGGGQAFGFHSDLRRVFVLQQRQSPAADEAQVDVGVALADAAQVLAESHVQLPVQAVLDRPVLETTFANCSAVGFLLKV